MCTRLAFFLLGREGTSTGRLQLRSLACSLLVTWKDVQSILYRKTIPSVRLSFIILVTFYFAKMLAARKILNVIEIVNIVLH